MSRPAPPRTPAGPTVADTMTPPGAGREDEARPGAGADGPELPEIDPANYRIAGEHARGGLGRVLRATDRRLDRTVAIKELTAEATSESAARFMREAMVTARLQHPGIVPVYEAGRWPDGSPFYAMKLVSGETLDDAIAARPTLEARLALLPSVLAVAEAIAYAHAEGVIHRDLKPANIMVGAFGETVVVDWGLARDRRVDDDRRAGAVVGTPAYMAPEQARGEPVDERADVWALGAILYQLLAAVPPFSGNSEAVLARVVAEPPPPVAEQAPGAPRDLVAIVDKAMARDPAARYPSAKQFAQDLSRFLAGQLVGAREYGRLTLLWRWLRRHRAPVTVGAVLLVALAITAGVSAQRIVREKNVARARSAELTLTQARSMLERDPTATLAWLKQYPADGGDWVGVRSVAADAFSRGVARHVFADHPEAVAAAAFSPDGTQVATASGELLQVWDAGSGARRARIKIAAINPGQMIFAPDGQSVALGGQAGEVTLEPLGGGDARVLGKHGSWVSALAFSPDGRSLASASSSGELTMWDVASGRGRELHGHTGTIATLVFVDQGRALVSVALDGQARRWDLASGEGQILFTVAPAEDINRADVSADGTRVAVAVGERVLAWRQGDAEARELGQQVGAVRTVLELPDGRVVSGGDDATVYVWPAGGGAPQTWLGHERPIKALAASADGATIASADARGDIRVWRGGGARVLHGHARTVARLAFSPDGAWLLSGGDDGAARLWSTATQGKLVSVATSDVFRLAFVDGGAAVATTSRDGGVRVLHIADGSVQDDGPQGPATYDLEVLPDGHDFVTGSWDGVVSLWHGAGGPAKQFRASKARLWAIGLSPDGQRVATACIDGSVHVFTFATGAVQVLPGHSSDGANDVAFSPDGRLVASSGMDGVVLVHDLASGADRTFTGHEAASNLLLFARDGRTLYSSGFDGTVRVWNLDTGQATVLRGHQGVVRALALSPDGHSLASGGADRLVNLWDLRTGEHRVLRGHEAEVRSLAFSPDGKLLASGGWDDTVRLWSLSDGHVSVFRGHVGSVQRVAFSPDGKLLASGGEDGAVGLWNVEDAAKVPERRGALVQWLGLITTAVVQVHGGMVETSL